ncbi:unnamed protein product, partial [Coccothraustes coccothraustes]
GSSIPSQNGLSPQSCQITCALGHSYTSSAKTVSGIYHHSRMFQTCQSYICPPQKNYFSLILIKK